MAIPKNSLALKENTPALICEEIWLIGIDWPVLRFSAGLCLIFQRGGRCRRVPCGGR
jgi:hypothetical protein